MQSKRDGAGPRRSSKIGGALGISSGLNFGEGEPYLDGDDDVAYLKRFQQFSGTGVKKKTTNYKMSGDSAKVKSEAIYGENSYGVNPDDNVYENGKTEGNGKKNLIEENEYGYIKETNTKKQENDKDSLEDEDNEDSSDNDIEDEYDLANPTSTPSQIPTPAKDSTLDPKASKYSYALESIRASLKDEGTRVNRTESMTERLSRDAMSLKRHQIRDSDATELSPSGGLDKKGGGKGGRDRSKSRSSRQKREESRKRVEDNRKPFKATHEIYGEDYPSKYHLPPRSPTFSFRSTIDLLPSSHRKQGLRQQVSCISYSES